MPDLTQREREVLRLTVDGLTNDEIAGRLGISSRTVEAHLRTLFRKTGVTRRTQLAGVGGDVEPEPDGSGEAVRRTSRDRSADLVALYAAALRRLIDRQFPLFDERVEITVVVGARDGQDAVVERRWTKPKPYLIYRILGPIVTWTGGPVPLDDLALECHVDGQDIQVDVRPMRDDSGNPFVLVVFQPGLSSETEWVLKYRSPGLWDPLRAAGSGSLTWATATADGRHQPSVDDLVVKVIFPADWTDPQVTERDGQGELAAEQLPTGEAQVSWRIRAPVAATFHWTLEGQPG
jgi:DNA-binding CsgD family transcriptional regulator